MRKPSVARACLWFFLGAAVSASVAMYSWREWQNDPVRLRATLLRNPQVIADSPEVLAAVRLVLRQRQLDSEAETRKRLLVERWGRFTHVAFSPSLGDPAARSTLIEFTDYDCEPCRASARSVLSALESHQDVRVAIMLLPISGPVSEFAARVGYAAYRQNPLQFARLHELLMSERGTLTAARVLQQAAASGLDVEQIQDESGTAEVRGYLAQVREFAGDLHVSGVPTFLFGKQLLAGGVSAGQINALVGSGPPQIAPAPRAH
jgi:protein-disulfide isomerase